MAVDPSGAIKWQLGLGGNAQTTPAIAPDGTIVIGAGNGALTVGPAATLDLTAATPTWHSASGSSCS